VAVKRQDNRGQFRKKLQEKLESSEVRFSERPEHATELARAALKGGLATIIAVGGDGTINEVINRFFIDGLAINGSAVLAL